MSEPLIQVMVEPVREDWRVGTVERNGKPLVVVEIYSINGLHVSFLDPVGARAVANDILNAAATIETGLILPAGVLVGGR